MTIEPDPDLNVDAAWERADEQAAIEADHWTEVTFDRPDPGIHAEPEPEAEPEIEAEA